LTSLHYTLIALGVGLVVAMFLYNILQERRSRKQAERIFGFQGDHVDTTDESASDTISLADVFSHDHPDDARIEPRISLNDDDARDYSGDQSPGQEAEFGGYELPQTPPAPMEVEETVVAPVESPPPAVAPQRGDLEPESPLLDSEIEYVARLRYSQPTPLLFATLQESLRRISKPIRLVGQREDGSWEPVLAQANRPYQTVELSVLLADRSGPVSDVQLDAFCRRLYEFAVEHGGAVSCQDKSAALERARALDGFCAEVDMLIGLNVVSPSGLDFSSQAIHELASRAGLIQAGDGGYALRDGDGRLLYSLATQNELLNPSHDGAQGTQGLSLLFDVPRVGYGLEAFDHMATLGFELAQRLGGQLVDDGGRPVSRDSLTKDRKRLEMIYSRMAQRGIPAGGERALRLFA
jgi:hypothetical protein